MAIILGHLIIFGDYETEKSENPGYNKVELWKKTLKINSKNN